MANFVRLPIDNALTFSDLIVKAVIKRTSTTGLTLTDTAHRNYPVAVSTTGLSVTDSIKVKPARLVADAALTVTTTLVATKNGANPSVNTTSIGLTVTDSIATNQHYFRSLPATGLTIHDGFRVTTSPRFAPRRPHADFTWTSSLLTANFADASTPGSAPIESWDWSFGDGATSSATNPTHTYAAGGTYIVRLTVTTIYGTSTVSKPVTVSGTAGPGTHIDGVIL